MAASKKHQSLKGDQLEREGQEKIREGEIAEAVAGPEVRCDGSGEESNSHAARVNEQLQEAEETDMTDDTDIQTGDICIDLAQGRPVHVLNDTGLTAAEWSEENNYELTENYGNGRLGASDDDRVFDVAYCSNIKSEPSKDYAFPESRLARIETEKADGGQPVADRVRVQVLEELFARAGEDDDQAVDVLEAYAVGTGLDADVVDEARELAEVETVIGGDE
jgi:hypothetical protein